MNTKKAYSAPALIVHGDVEEITLGTRNLVEDAFFGADGTDGVFGPKCDRKDFGFACGS
ncbi:MAG: lasso peptide [Cyanobacteria bacterium P01_D01_bin.156]